MSITLIDSTKNIYETSNYNRIAKEEIKFEGKNVTKLTYRNSQSLIWKIVQVVALAFITFASLFSLLCFSKGRKLWEVALGRFSDQMVYIENLSPQNNPSQQSNSVPQQPSNVPVQISSNSVPHVLSVQPSNPQPVNVQPINVQPGSSSTEEELKLIKQSILKDNPQWEVQVNAWKGISISDQVWLLRLFELRKLDVEITPFDEILNRKDKTKIFASDKIKEVLKQRNAIEQSMASVTSLNCHGKGLKKISDAICLLTNLENINLNSNELETLPDLSQFVKLKELLLNSNKFTKPPQLIKNIKLRSLRMINNKLTISPDLNQNTELVTLDLSGNQLKKPPVLKNNGKLESFNLQDNLLELTPDFSQNPKLKRANLSSNKLTKFPDLSNNVDLEFFNLSNNQILDLPGEEIAKALRQIPMKIPLTEIYMKNNPCCVGPFGPGGVFLYFHKNVPFTKIHWA